MNNNDLREKLIIPAVVGALYAALTMLLAPISYGNLQFRISEALCVLPVFFPYTSVGLFLGCALANMISAAGILDVVFGSRATLCAGLCAAACGREARRTGAMPSAAMRVLACLSPVVWNGVVIGALTPDGELDLAQMRRMMACAGQMEVTLHRAFDMTRDPFRALEDAVSLGCRTILSSGQAANAALGAPLLAKLNGQAAGRIDLMAGCGVKRTNIAGIAAQTGITTFHTTGRKGSVDSGMRYRKEGVSMGLPSLSEYELWLTDEAEFRACAETVHALGTPGAQA